MAGKLCGGKGCVGAGQQLAETEPTMCPGRQEDQWHRFWFWFSLSTSPKYTEYFQELFPALDRIQNHLLSLKTITSAGDVRISKSGKNIRAGFQWLTESSFGFSM